jgi:tetratricopeptide (TPR) repeat protein
MKDQQTLDLENFDIVDVVPIPMTGDRMIRLRTLEEAISDFDSDTESVGYFVQMRPRNRSTAAPTAATASREPSLDMSTTLSNIPSAPEPSMQDIYVANGKINLPYLIRTAELLMNSKDYSLARNVYRTILQSGERTDLAKYGLGRCYEAEGKLDEALFQYEESIAYHPQPEVFLSLATLLIRKEKNQEAAEVIERALQLKDIAAELRFELHRTAGNCWSRVGNLRDADKQYRKALELRPEADEMLGNLGVLYLQHNKINDAEKCFNEAVKANPKNHQALTGLGSCALAEGNQLAAHAWFARALSAEIRIRDQELLGRGSLSRGLYPGRADQRTPLVQLGGPAISSRPQSRGRRDLQKDFGARARAYRSKHVVSKS